MTRSDENSSSTNRYPIWRLIFLSIGFLAFTIGTFVAWQSPATGYEISVYRGTPIIFWIGIGIAFLAAGIVTVINSRDILAGIAVCLGVLATVSIGGLPVIRNYRMYGHGDALTHLGWTNDLRSGVIDIFDLFYPGAHSISVLFGELAGLPTERAMLLFMAFMVGVFTIFIPMSTYAITNQSRPTVIAAFSGFMLLPFTTISTALHFHTYSIALLFLPVVLFFLAKYLLSGTNSASLWNRQATPERSIDANGNGRESLWNSFNGWKIALLGAGLAMLLYHPQVKLNVILLIGTLVGIHLIFRNRTDHPIASLQPVYLVFLVLAVVWLVWMLEFPGYFGRWERISEAVIETLRGTADPGGSEAVQRESLRMIGGSLTELILKIFLIPLVYCLFALVASLATIFNKTNGNSPTTDSMVSYFTVAGIVLIPFFLAHYAGDVSHLFFRHIGFGMVLVSIVGAIGIHLVGSYLWEPEIRNSVRGAAVILLVVALVLALLVAFPSPWIYNQSQHVTNQQMEGYDTAFTSSDTSIGFSGVRSGPSRYTDALNRGSDNPSVGALNGTEMNNPSAARDSLFYLGVSRIDYEREVVAYKELAVTAQAIDNLDFDQNVHRILDNGEFRLYLIEGDLVRVDD